MTSPSHLHSDSFDSLSPGIYWRVLVSAYLKLLLLFLVFLINSRGKCQRLVGNVLFSSVHL